MSGPQPEAVWVFPPKKSRGPRIALIVLLVVLALIVAAGLAVFLIPHGDDGPAPSAGPSVSPTPSATSTPTPSPTPTVSVPPSEAPTAPATTAPVPPDPSVAEFRGQVQPRLDDATTGLALAQGTSGDAAVQIVDALQNDAQNLAGQSAPDSIRSAWGGAVSDYAAKLQTLRSAFSAGSDASGALADARSALAGLRALVGL